jgi:hypothetical protein
MDEDQEVMEAIENLSPNQKEERLRLLELYRQRFDQGLAIFTGEPLSEDDKRL